MSLEEKNLHTLYLFGIGEESEASGEMQGVEAMRRWKSPGRYIS